MGHQTNFCVRVVNFVIPFSRFRNHMIDLTFIERVQRWITNSQVRIKTEVQHCNGMGANIARHVRTVKSRIDACKFPNPDKEV